MNVIKSIFNSSAPKAEQKKGGGAKAGLQDEAIDTVGCFIWTLGQESFCIDGDLDPEVFPEQCKEVALHVKIGASVPSAGIDQSPDGTRQWSKVRHFFVNRRKREKEFVATRLNDYRGFVTELVSGLREIGKSDHNAGDTIRKSLQTVEGAVNDGSLPAIRQALSKTIEDVSETLEQQKQEYETRISELNERMSSLREDLVSTREEMKRDPLTEIYNRGAFDAAIQHSVNVQFMSGIPVTLVLIDVDNFKEINDTYGHAAGDGVLQSISRCLERSFIRRSDLISRFGGDEFAVILNDTTSENAVPLIKRFMAALQDISVPYAPQDVRVTCSVGYTGLASADDVAGLLQRADASLYVAKQEGKDCARHLAPTLEQTEPVATAQPAAPLTH